MGSSFALIGSIVVLVLLLIALGFFIVQRMQQPRVTASKDIEEMSTHTSRGEDF